MVAGVAYKREGENIFPGNLVCGQLQEKGPWVAEGKVDQVCPGGHCFVVLWRKLFGLHRMARRQHMRKTWGNENGTDLGVRFAAQIRTCEGWSQQTPLGRGLMRNGTPCRVWPLDEEQGTGARAIAGRTKEVVLSSPRPGRTREVVTVTDMETGKQTIQLRVADGVSEREVLETRNVYEGADEEQLPYELGLWLSLSRMEHCNMMSK